MIQFGGCWTGWSHSALNHLNPSTPLCISERQWNMHKNTCAFLQIPAENLPRRKNDLIIISLQVNYPRVLPTFSLSLFPSQPSTHTLLHSPFLPLLSLPFSYWWDQNIQEINACKARHCFLIHHFCALYGCPYWRRSCLLCSWHSNDSFTCSASQLVFVEGLLWYGYLSRFHVHLWT